MHALSVIVEAGLEDDATAHLWECGTRGIEVRPLRHHFEVPVALPRERLQRFPRRGLPHERHGVGAHLHGRLFASVRHFPSPMDVRGAIFPLDSTIPLSHRRSCEPEA